IVSFERAAHGSKQQHLVVEHQNPGAAGKSGTQHRRWSRGARAGSDRQDDAKRAALTKLASNFDLSVERVDDLMADEQAQTPADTGRFGGEERFEDAFLNFRLHARAGVFDFDDDARSVAFGADRDFVRLRMTGRNRLSRIHQQVEKNLTETELVTAHWRQA